MSVRAVAADRGARPRLRVLRPPRALRLAWRTRFTDDRKLVGLKLVLLAALMFLAMALEFRL